MEKKLKFSEFAELIGVTAKTVYKMKDREEIKTVIEKVNGREIQLVITNTEEIEKFRSMNGKSTNNNGNYEDMLTDNNDIITDIEYTRVNNRPQNINDFVQGIIDINEEHTNQLNKLNEELATYKGQQLLLEDRQQREGAYLNEINELREENERLKTDKLKVFYRSLIVIVILSLVLIGYILFNLTILNYFQDEEQKKEYVRQEVVQDVQKPAKQTVKNR